MKKLTKSQLRLIKAFVTEFGDTEKIGTRSGGTIVTTHFNCNLTVDNDYEGDQFHINGHIFRLKDE